MKMGIVLKAVNAVLALTIIILFAVLLYRRWKQKK